MAVEHLWWKHERHVRPIALRWESQCGVCPQSHHMCFSSLSHPPAHPLVRPPNHPRQAQRHLHDADVGPARLCRLGVRAVIRGPFACGLPFRVTTGHGILHSDEGCGVTDGFQESQRRVSMEAGGGGTRANGRSGDDLGQALGKASLVVHTSPGGPDFDKASR